MHLRHTRREGTPLSLQEPLEGYANDSGQLTLADTLPDDTVMEDDCERRVSVGRLRALIQKLPPREEKILAMRYGLNGGAELTQQAVAERLGISRSYVSRCCYCKKKRKNNTVSTKFLFIALHLFRRSYCKQP